MTVERAAVVKSTHSEERDTAEAKFTGTNMHVGQVIRRNKNG